MGLFWVLLKDMSIIFVHLEFQASNSAIFDFCMILWNFLHFRQYFAFKRPKIRFDHYHPLENLYSYPSDSLFQSLGPFPVFAECIYISARMTLTMTQRLHLASIILRLHGRRCVLEPCLRIRRPETPSGRIPKAVYCIYVRFISKRT